MSFAKKAVAATVLTVVATSASAALVKVQEQTLTHGPAATYWGQMLTFNLYDKSAYGNRELKRVELELSGKATTELSFKAINSAVLETSGTVGAALRSTATLNNTNITVNVAPNTTLSTGEVAAGETHTFAPQTSSDSKTETITDTSILSLFSGTGIFNVDLKAYGTVNFSGIGGNISTTQLTNAEGAYTVRYFVEEKKDSTVPAPASLALFGLGLLAMSRKRKAA